jgi:hypothetical protein
MNGFRSVTMLAMVILSALSLQAPTLAQEPLDGLSPGVRELVSVVNSGEAQAIAGRLADGPIIRTAYPGDGIEVTRAVAATDFAWMVVSNRGVTDAHGSGRYRVFAVWTPANQPASVRIAASGVDSSGLRITTVFGTDPEGSAITSYGRAGNMDQLFEQWNAQGDLHLLPEAPRPPATGTSQATSGRLHRTATAFCIMVALVGALVLVTSVRMRHGRSS